jgi:hypothetical protein
MIDSRKVLAAAAFACSAALPNMSPAQPATDERPAQDTVFYVAGGAAVTPFGGQIDVIGGQGAVIGGVVKDKPYTASSITDSTQVLADGNRIVNRNEARIYRDSEGRTRREQTLSGLGVWQTANEPLTMVTINDPVAEASYFIDPVGRTVRKLQPFRLALENGATWTHEVAAPPPGEPAAGQRVFMNRAIVADVTVARPIDPNAAEPPVPFEVPLPPPGAGVAVRGAVGAGAGPVAMRAFGAAPVAGAFGFPGAQTVTEDLGEQVLEGVLARGTRHTQTIPAGTIGNERAIDIVAEQWYSDEIEAVVLRRNLDPRFGETTYRLVNLVRGEPSPDLFTAPADFQVQSEPAFGMPNRVELRAFGQGAEQDANAELGPGAARAERRVFLVKPDQGAASK